MFPERAFEAPDGILLNDLAGALSGTFDPSVSGQAAPTGTLFLRTNGEHFKKIAAGDTDWQEITSAASGIFGNDYQTATSLGQSSTTSRSFVEKLTFTTTSLPPGDYIIIWNSVIGADDEKSGVSHRVQLDDTTDLSEILDATTENKVAWSRYASGHSIQTLSGVHQLDIDFADAGDDNATAIIRDARITLWRVA